MRLSLIKKCIIGSIIVLISIIPLLDVSAQNLGGIDVPSFESSTELTNLMKTYPNLSLYRHSSGNIRLLLSLDPHIASGKVIGVNNYKIGGYFGNGEYVKVYVFEFDTSNNKWINKGYDYWGVETKDVIWTNHDIYYNNEVVYHKTQDFNINLSYSISCDLNNIDMAIIKADFSSVYDSDYRYQIKTEYTDWIDITSIIHTSANEGYYFYDFTTYYNVNFETRVLNLDDSVLYEKNINVSELSNFGMNISHAPAEDLQGRYVNTVTVDLINCWNDNYVYQYSFDNKKFYNMNVTNDVKKYWLNHGIQTFLYFRILDSESNVIYTKNYTEIFEGVSWNILYSEDTGIDKDGKKFITLEIDFSQFRKYQDMYNLYFYINDELIEYGTNCRYTIYSTDFDAFKELRAAVYVDNVIVEFAVHAPNYGDITFDDKYDDIIDDKLEEDLGEQDYSSIGGLFKTVANFIKSISNFVFEFFRLIMYFFYKLNIWIRSATIGLFIIMVVCRIIKAVRK